jgi:hypothetical protein
VPSSAAATSVALLRPCLLEGGGFSERPGGRFRPDATAWAILALAGAGAEGRGIAEQACVRLVQAQQPDGSVPMSAAHLTVIWPTALALLAWQALGVSQEAQTRAADFLVKTAGSVGERDRSPEAGHDVSLHGWPWTNGTHSWVEPTTQALLALRRAGQGSHPRVEEGIRLLLDRQLPRGGWNYGNTVVFGTELTSQPDATGAALAALADVAPPEAVERSLSLLERDLPGIDTPVSLSWSIIGLERWNRRPRDSQERIAGCFSLEGRYGGYGTTAMAMLLIAGDGGGVLG